MGSGSVTQANAQDLTGDSGVRFTVRTDPIHGVPETEQAFTGAIQRAQSGSTGIDQGLVDIE